MNFIIAGKVASYAGGLDALKDDDRLRHLGPRTGIDFSSNDCLALASAPHIKKAILTALEPVLRSERADHGFCAATARSTAASKQQRRGSSARRPCPSSAVVISQVLRC